MFSLCVLMAVAAHENFEVHQIDVDSAFLNGLIDTEIYIEQPIDYIDKQVPDHVYLLLKSLYSLKQASRIWHTLLKSVLLELGFKSAAHDPCVFIVTWENIDKLMIAIHIDDFTEVDHPAALQNFEQKMSSVFKIKILEQAKFILGIQIRVTEAGIALSQEIYLTQVIDAVRGTLTPTSVRDLMSNFSPLSYPITFQNIRACFAAEEESTLLTKKEIGFYREFIGKLMYVSVGTRLDISFALNFLAHFSAAPYRTHLETLICLLRYVHGILSLSIRYLQGEAGKPFIFDVFTDASFANDLLDCRSTSEYIAMTRNSASLDFESRKQTFVTKSTFESETVALDEGARSAIWLRELLGDLGYLQKDPTILYEDNELAIAFSKHSSDFKRTKHIHIRYCYV
jgi:hypothetical protein